MKRQIINIDEYKDGEDVSLTLFFSPDTNMVFSGKIDGKPYDVSRDGEDPDIRVRVREMDDLFQKYFGKTVLTAVKIGSLRLKK